jgi:iron complex transport system substrate-binding protein
MRGVNRQKIVSLLPSCTEIVCALDCGEQLAGRSHECDFPPEIASIPICTAARLDSAAASAAIDAQVKSISQGAASLYEIDAAKLRALRPDIILTQTQCEVCAVSLADLEKALLPPPARRPEIVSVSPARVADIWKDVQMIAEALGVAERGRKLLWRLKNRVVDVIQKTCLMKNRPAVACLEWLDPLMAAGNWMPEVVDLAGGRDPLGVAGVPSRWLTWEALAKSNPDVILLMPCGFGLERARREAAVLENHPAWRKLRAVKTKNVFAADGNHFFNRPGPRMADSIEILAEILHPKMFSFGQENRSWARL